MHISQHGGELESVRREATQSHLTHQHTKTVYVYLGCLSAPVFRAHLRGRVHSCSLEGGGGKVTQVG